jgi:hypothetical protein
VTGGLRSGFDFEAARRLWAVTVPVLHHCIYAQATGRHHQRIGLDDVGDTTAVRLMQCD